MLCAQVSWVQDPAREPQAGHNKHNSLGSRVESRSVHLLPSLPHPFLCSNPEGSPSSYLTYTLPVAIAACFLWVLVDDAIVIIPH
jgi:hypothetical protein